MEKYIVESMYNDMRLDKVLVFILSNKSRVYVSHMIEENKVLLNGKIAKGSNKVKEGDIVEYQLLDEKPLDLKSEDIPLDIIYEDQDIIVINKPQGMVVHPAPGNYEHTLVNALLSASDSLSSINGVVRPGIVHRIDKDTSGLICVAKNDAAHHALSEQLKDHSMARTYIALVNGVIKENHGHIDLPIGRSRGDRKKMAVDTENGKEAITNFDVVKRYKEYTLIECHLVTGRTHQIRVHMSYIGYPINSDPLYNKKKANKLHDDGQLLVATKLHLIHPTSKKAMDFEIPLPDYFTKILDSLN